MKFGTTSGGGLAALTGTTAAKPDGTVVSEENHEMIDKNRDDKDAKLQPAGTPVSNQPTAKEVGIDMDHVSAEQELTDQLHVAQNGGILDSVTTIFTSHPIQNFAIGPFQFEKGSLQFTGDEPKGLDLGTFQNLLDTLPATDRAAIREVSVGAAEALVKDFQLSSATKQIDSGAGRQALERLHMLSPTVGVQDITHAALPQMDNNTPVIATPAVDEQGETGLDQGPHSTSEAIDEATGNK